VKNECLTGGDFLRTFDAFYTRTNEQTAELTMIYHANVCRLDGDVIDFAAAFDECELDDVKALH